MSLTRNNAKRQTHTDSAHILESNDLNVLLCFDLHVFGQKSIASGRNSTSQLHKVLEIDRLARSTHAGIGRQCFGQNGGEAEDFKLRMQHLEKGGGFCAGDAVAGGDVLDGGQNIFAGGQRLKTLDDTGKHLESTGMVGTVGDEQVEQNVGIEKDFIHIWRP